MVAGLDEGEELALATAENRRYRAALDLAVQGSPLRATRDMPDASEVIADVNASPRPQRRAGARPSRCGRNLLP